MRKKLWGLLTILFFGVMLLGTFFHQKIDAYFRVRVQLVNIDTYSEEYRTTVEVSGEEIEVIQKDIFLLLPREAIRESQVYVVETVAVPYGHYEVVRLKKVQTDGEKDSMVKVTEGITEEDKVVVFDDALSDGMRVVVHGM